MAWHSKRSLGFSPNAIIIFKQLYSRFQIWRQQITNTCEASECPISCGKVKDEQPSGTLCKIIWRTFPFTMLKVDCDSLLQQYKWYLQKMFNLTWPSLVNGAENVALVEAKTRSKRGRVVNMIPTLNIVSFYVHHSLQDKAMRESDTLSKIFATVSIQKAYCWTIHCCYKRLGKVDQLWDLRHNQYYFGV